MIARLIGRLGAYLTWVGCRAGVHTYLSTSCLHEDHEYCQSNTGLCGQKAPGVCKWCCAPCLCSCHQEGKTQDR